MNGDYCTPSSLVLIQIFSPGICGVKSKEDRGRCLAALWIITALCFKRGVGIILIIPLFDCLFVFSLGFVCLF